MQPDISEYLPLIEEWDLPLEKKEEVIRNVCNFMQQYVDHVFDEHYKV